MKTQDLTGRCLCGAVQFEAKGVATEIHACHCGMCRRWSGAAAMGTAAGEVRFSGEENIARYESSDWAERGFCKSCGTHLFYKLKAAEHYVLWTGCLDDLSQFQLTGEIYIEDKPAFYDFAGERPRMTGAEFLASIGMGPDA